MKNITTYLLLGASLAMPLSAMAAPDLNDVTMDVINLNDSHADAVMKQIDLPDVAEHAGQERDNHNRGTNVNEHNGLSLDKSEMQHENEMSQERDNEMQRENEMEREQENQIERENTVQQDQQLDRDSDHGMNSGARHSN